MKRVYTLVLFFSLIWLVDLSAQQTIQHNVSLQWSDTDPLKFSGAGSFSADPRLPIYTYRFPINGPATITVGVSVSNSENFTLTSFTPKINLPRNYQAGGIAEQDRGVWYAKVWFLPAIS